MKEFSRWYIEFLKTIGNYIAQFFIGIYNFFVNMFYTRPKEYFISFVDASAKFQVFDWLAAVVILLINIIFIGALLYLIIQYLKKYIRFTRKEIDKESLINEISSLNRSLIEVTNEKNTILALKSEDLGLGSIGFNINSNIETNQTYKTEETEEKKNQDSRFVKLIDVDETYQYTVLQTHMHESDEINLNQLVKRFINFSASQLKLYYTPETVSVFFSGMAASKTMILEGISGTGKTSLPYAMGKFFNNDANIISVQPSWRDRAEMIGYLNEFTKRFNETDFLKAIYETTYRTDINLIILDEMNLARVEYYFAEFLSIMELPDPKEWLIDITPDQIPGDPIHLRNGKLLLPQNVWFIGTANKDDSTFTITDKVYDRASSIEMNKKAEYIDAQMTSGVQMTYEYLDTLFKKAEKEHALSLKTIDDLTKLDDFITEKFQITFGNRIMKQIKTFVPVYVACGQKEIDGLDYIVARKIIRKFESLNIAFLQPELEQLLQFFDKTFGKKEFKESRKLIAQYQKQL